MKTLGRTDPQSRGRNRGKIPPVAHRFKPGQSGNPGGRPKGLMTYIRSRTKDGRELADFLLAVMHGARVTSGRGTRGHTPHLRERLEAAKVLLARGWGTIPAVENDDFPTTLIVRVSDRDWADLHGLPWKGGNDET